MKKQDWLLVGLLAFLFGAFGLVVVYPFNRSEVQAAYNRGFQDGQKAFQHNLEMGLKLAAPHLRISK